MKRFRVNSFEIKFLASDGHIDEFHKSVYRIKPFCSSSNNILETIIEDINKAIGEDKRRYIIVVKTYHGEFIFTGRGKK